MLKTIIKTTVALALVGSTVHVSADPFPPNWDNGSGAAVHFSPVAWPDEPANPQSCGDNCGDWKPYTRFQNSMNDLRNKDPSNGGTSPQSYVNVSSSCSDGDLPSIYYYLHQGPTPEQDVVMFRWRVEAAPNTYATGPNTGSYGSSDPWSSALWSVLFDVDGTGYTSLAAHLDGSSGSPSTAIDKLVGIWSKNNNHSLDYVSDPNVVQLAHNPTAFVGPTGKILNFNGTNTPSESWPNGSGETEWDYGSTRAKLVSTSSCNEYFVDYQIPVAMLDASAEGGPKITRETPIAMLFCTANSLNNPFQKDCAISNNWTANSAKPAPFGDYISFNQEESYSQPIIKSLNADAPLTCPGSFELEAIVQDALALQSGEVVPSVKGVDFYYWYDQNSNGEADEADGEWVKVPQSAALAQGSQNLWEASWDSTSLPKGRYLIGAQAVDDNTKVDTGMTPSGVDNRTFSYLTGDAANKIYIDGTWTTGQQAAFPDHSPSITPSATENWYANPAVSEQQIFLISTAINACGVSPAIDYSVSKSELAAGESTDFTVTITNPPTNISVDLDDIVVELPPGFTYTAASAAGTGGLPSTEPTIVGDQLIWANTSTLAAGATATLDFSATATSTAGQYNSSVSTVSSFGLLESEPVALNVDGVRLSLDILPSSYSIVANGSSQLTYTIQYSNDSSLVLQDPTLDFVLPTGVTYVSCSGGDACSENANTVTFGLPDLGSYDSGSVTVVITVPESWTSSSLNVTAELAATAPDTSEVTKSASRKVSVSGYQIVGEPEMRITKTANAVTVTPGNTVTYTLAYENVGTATAENVVITDTLPIGVTYVSSTSSGVFSSGDVTWSIGTVNAGATGFVTLTVSAPNPYVGANPFVNSASIDWTGAAAPIGSNSSFVGVTGNTCNTYHYTGTKFNANPGNVYIAEALAAAPNGTVTEVLASVGGTDTEVASFIQEPAALTSLEINGTIDSNMSIQRPSGGGVVVTVKAYLYTTSRGAELASGTVTRQGSDSSDVTIPLTFASGAFTIPKDARIEFVYLARSSNANQTRDITLQFGGLVTGVPTNSNAVICTQNPASLIISAAVEPDEIEAGSTETLTYSIDYANTGNDPAANAIVSASLPAGMTACEASTDGTNWSACSGATSHQFATITSVGSGANGTLYLRGAAPSGSVENDTLDFTASIVSDDTPSIGTTAQTSVIAAGGGGGETPNPELSLSIAASSTFIVPVETVNYTIKAVNTGNTTLENVVVTSELPVADYFDYVSCTGCSVSGNELSWTIASMAAGTDQDLTFSAELNGTNLPAGISLLSHTADATADGGVSAAANTVQLSVSGNPSLTAGFTATPNTGLEPDDTVNYSLVIENDGNATATDVRASIPLANYLSLASDLTISGGTATVDYANNRLIVTASSLEPAATINLSYSTTIGEIPAGTTTITSNAKISAANAGQQTVTNSVTASAAPILGVDISLDGSSAVPAAIVNSATTGTVVNVDRTVHFLIGQYVKFMDSGEIRRIVALNSNSITLNSTVTVTADEEVYGAVTADINYRNSGNAAATSSELTVDLPIGLTFYSASPAATSDPGVNNTGSITWVLGTLDADEAGTAQLILFSSGASGAQAVDVTLSEAAVTDATDQATIAFGGITVEKTSTGSPIFAGDEIDYEITLSNSLGSSVSAVSVVDTLASGFSYKAGSATVGGVASEPSFDGSDTSFNVPSWTGLTVPASGSLVIAFTVEVSSDVGAGTYQNLIQTTVPSSVGLTDFDGLTKTTEDVSVVGIDQGSISGFVYKRNGTASSFDAETDTLLSSVKMEIYQDGADCSNLYATDCRITYTDDNGGYQITVPTGEWFVRAVPGTGDLNNSWNLVFGTNDQPITVAAGGSYTDTKGYDEEVITYTVTFNDHENQFIADDEVNHGDAATAPTPPTRTGYTFAGWDTDFSAVTSDLTVTATYTLNTYTVTFDVGAGERTGGGALVQTVDHGSDATAPTVNAPAGSTFSGWDVGFTNVTADITVTAQYAVIQYTVRFLDWDGAVLKSETVNWGGAATAPGSPSRTGYTFTGWNPSDYSSITENTDITAQYSINQYTVTFEDFDGSALGTDTVDYNTAATAPTDPTRTGYTFTGWDTSFTNVTGDITVTAEYTINTYTVTFNLNGGTRTGGGELTQTVNHGSAATAPIFDEPTGETFTGWSTTFDNVTSDLTVNALYDDVTLTVRFLDHDAEVLKTESVVYGSGATAPTDPTRTGYTFTGWSPADYSNITTDTDVTAQYSINEYTVTFVDHDATELKVETVDYGNDATAPTDPTRTGYTFTGWDTSFTNVTGD
ncbi:InlB B-repeat-containing protein, partial [Pseudidiomarina aestuarii]|uniref:InlB B-repeat-containing protein n=1 Tax=Pseudidiomarina aestuarii TaxID=624146 RepID=UPI003A986651